MERTVDAVVGGLRLAKEGVAWLPVSVPGLAPALEVALKLAEAAQETKDAKDGCRALAERAARLLLGIYEQLRRRAPDVGLSCENEHIEDLISALGAIEALMRRRGKMGVVRAFLHRDDLISEAKRLGMQLDDAFMLFSAQDSIANRQDLKQITNTVIRLDQRTENEERRGEIMLKQLSDLTQRVAMSTVEFDEDGTMILRHEDIEFLKELHPSLREDYRYWARYWAWEEETESEDSQSEGAQDEDVQMEDAQNEEVQNEEIQNAPPEDEDQVVRYLGRIKKTGKLVIIKKFPRQDEEYKDSLRRAKEYLRLSKASPNPHVTFMAGYSAPDVQYGFLAIEEQKPLEEVFDSLQGVEKYLRTIEMELLSAFKYLQKDLALSEEGPAIPLDQDDLYFTQEGTVRWNIDTWTHTTLPYVLYLSNASVELNRQEAVEPIDIRGLKRSLNSRDPIERAAALFILWDGVMAFADFKRTEWNIYSHREITWVGNCLEGPGFYVYNSDGDQLECPMDTVQYERHTEDPYIHHFDEASPDVDYDILPDPSVVVALMQSSGYEGPVQILETVQVDLKWRRHTVINMDYGVVFRVVQHIMETIPCRNFFLTEAINLDIARHMPPTGEYEETVSTARNLDFILATHLVSLSPDRISKPPPLLYFYEVVQSEETVRDFGIPWGYWSTSPEPIPDDDFPYQNEDEPEPRASHLWFSREHGTDIEYTGFRYVKHSWNQTLEGFVFRIEVMVVLETHQVTMDERWLLEDVGRSLEEAYKLFPREDPEDVRERVKRKRVTMEDPEQRKRNAKLRRYGY
ncbi:hypothetical protein BC628DRAFT_1415161 [Trametes gibbosa]|nr:hypothetical protein BC628DRAFT_1415161 [Trametes gibbosa]